MGTHIKTPSPGPRRARPRPPRMGAHINRPSPARLPARPPAGGPEVDQILDSVRRVVRVLRVSSRAAEKQVGLSAAQLFVLHVLAGRPASSINEVAQLTRTHQSSVSVVVQRLVDRGLIEKAPAPGDARRTALSVTPAAMPLLRDAPDAPTEILLKALERMPGGVRVQLARSLARLAKELGAAEGPATMLFEDDPTPPAGAPKKRRAKGADGVAG